MSDSSNLIITCSRTSVSLALSQHCYTILKISPGINPGVGYYILVLDFSLVLNVLRCLRFIKNLWYLYIFFWIKDKLVKCRHNLLLQKLYWDSSPRHNVTTLPDWAVERSNHYALETRHSKRWYTMCEKWFK